MNKEGIKGIYSGLEGHVCKNYKLKDFKETVESNLKDSLFRKWHVRLTACIFLCIRVSIDISFLIFIEV